MKDLCPWCGAKERTNKNCEHCTGIECLDSQGSKTDYVLIPKKRCEASVPKLKLVK